MRIVLRVGRPALRQRIAVVEAVRHSAGEAQGITILLACAAGHVAGIDLDLSCHFHLSPLWYSRTRFPSRRASWSASTLPRLSGAVTITTQSEARTMASVRFRS